MNKLKSSIFIGISSVLLIACNSDQTKNNTADVKDSVDATAAIPVTNVVLKDNEINAAYNNYILLKNALVTSNVEETRKAASSLSGSLSNIDGCENTAKIAEKIANSSDLKNQRADFTTLSSDLIALMKHADVEEGTMYVQYCPMANSGDGGYWMASTSEVRNPYYGDEMLNCGEVKETITKK